MRWKVRSTTILVAMISRIGSTMWKRPLNSTTSRMTNAVRPNTGCTVSAALTGSIAVPSFPKWLIDGTRPTRAAWFLKERVLPPVYWYGMLKGREWLARPEGARTAAPAR